MKSLILRVRELSDRFLWHVCHALVVFLLFCVVFERLVPGAVLGHLSLFVAVPTLIVCLVLHPLTTRRTTWWKLVDLWLIGALCIARIWMQLAENGPVAWFVAFIASGLVVAFAWLFTSQAV